MFKLYAFMSCDHFFQVKWLLIDYCSPITHTMSYMYCTCRVRDVYMCMHVHMYKVHVYGIYHAQVSNACGALYVLVSAVSLLRV